MQSGFQKRNNPPHLVYVGFLTLFSFALYWQIFTYNTFGPETALFYFYNHGQTFRQMIRGYTYVTLSWYRPTGFTVPYWVVQQFADWHNLVAWKVAHFFTVLGAAFA